MSEIIRRVLRYVQQFPLLRHHHDEAGHRLEKPHETCILVEAWSEITLKEYNEREDARKKKKKRRRKKEKKKKKRKEKKEIIIIRDN